MTLEAATIKANELNAQGYDVVAYVCRTFKMFRNAWKPTDSYGIRFHKTGETPDVVIDGRYMLKAV
jgi:hypothetical protein